MKACTKCGQTKPLSDFWIERRRNQAQSHCKKCKATAQKLWRKANPQKVKDRYWNNPQGERERHLIRKYGVTQADYDMMFSAQGGGCAVCKKAQARAFDVDHCHATGRVRGLLCTNCNRMIGHAGDDAGRLIAAAAYLGVTP
jgi:hypothetical protein